MSDLTALLLMHSVNSVYAEENEEFIDILGIYRWAIAIKVNHSRVDLLLESHR